MAVLSIDGADLFYKEAGDGAPILLIHGTSIDADTWAGTFDALAATHRVVAYDRRGHSRSRDAGAAATADWDRHAADAAAFIERLGMAPATVAGWSAGGLIATKLAIARPDLVRSLVLMEPAFDVPHNLTARYVRHFLRAQVLFALGRDTSAYEGFVRFVCTRRGMIDTWSDPAFPEARRAVGRANAGALKAEMAARRALPAMDDVRAIRVPVTVVLGELSDPWFEKMASAVPRAIPHATIHRIPNANHAFGFTAPVELAEAIRAAAPASATAQG